MEDNSLIQGRGIILDNYLEHEDKVKFVDGVLAKSQEWQWFIECVEQKFELDDIKNYEEFKKKNIPLREILGKFIRIVEVSDKEWIFTQDVLQDLFCIARFSVGAVSIDDCRSMVLTNMGKIILTIVWLTKLENSDNGTDYIIDMRFISQKNFFQTINMKSFVTEEDEIIKYLDSININGFEFPKKCIKDNLLQVPYGITQGFIEKYKKNLLSPNVFNFQCIQKEEYLTWQEDTLLDMLSISIKKKMIVPFFSNGNNVVPDYRLWTNGVINQIKEFFHNPVVDFVTESVNYIKNGMAPNRKVIDIHCKMLKELIEKEDEFSVYSSSTYTIISSLFSDGSMKNIEKKGDLLDLIKCVQKVDSNTLLLHMREDGFPLSKNQNNAIKKFIVEQYKTIINIDDISHLNNYLRNKDIAQNITQPYYEMIKPKFLKMLDNPRQQLIPMLFYQAMQFLIVLNQTNQQVNKRKVRADMISLQEYWQNYLYTEQSKTLHEVMYSTSFAAEDVETYNNGILINPIFLAKQCLRVSTEEILEIMVSISEHPFLYLVDRMVLSPIYPLKGCDINLANRDIDNLLRIQVEDIKNKFGYKLLNVLKTDSYVAGIHEYYQQFATFSISMFTKEETLYHKVEALIDTRLIQYEEDIQLGHLTQLFPILEIQIRRLGKMAGIVPFKEKMSDFMKFKDPSSVLRELLGNIYKELGSFENVPDLLFVYHFMYNGNSLNIRNECIHGRDYIVGSRLKFAFKVTLLALYMIIYRIGVIEKNEEVDQ